MSDLGVPSGPLVGCFMTNGTSDISSTREMLFAWTRTRRQ